MSLGPCADSVGLSSAGVYGMAVLQLPVLFIATIHYPSVKADFFSTKAQLVFNPETNHSAVNLREPTEMHYFHSVHVSIIFLACAALAAAFITISLHILDKGLVDPSNPRQTVDIQYEDFVSTNGDLASHPTITMWNNCFLSLVVAYHALLVTIVNSPTSIHFLALVSLLIYFSISSVIQPRLQVPEGVGGAAATNVSSFYLLAIAAYCAAMAYTATNVPYDPHSYRAELIGAVVFLDLFLLIMGHTWDPCPNFTTVANCRVIWAACVSVMNIVTYAAWDSAYRVEYIDVPSAPPVLPGA